MAKKKVRVPKIQIDKKGKRFIRLGKKKVVLSKNVTERELIKFIINRLKPKRKARPAGKAEGKTYPSNLPQTGMVSQFYDKIQAQSTKVADQIHKVKNELEREIKQIEYNPGKQDDKMPRNAPIGLLKYLPDEPEKGYTEAHIQAGLKLLREQEREIKQLRRQAEAKHAADRARKKAADIHSQVVEWKKALLQDKDKVREMAKQRGIKLSNNITGVKTVETLI